MRITYSALISATTLALLSACATNASNPGASNSQAGTASSSSATVAKSEPAPAPQAEIKVTPAPFKDGTVVVFSKTGTTLEQADVDYLAQYAATFKKAKSIQIMGYCNRKDNILNAQQVALTRATAVRTELIKLGVAGSKISLKYNTEDDRHSVSIQLK